jgi:type VI secretion system secreted protein Hcp
MLSKTSSKGLVTLLFVVLAAFLMGSHTTQIGEGGIALFLRANGADIQGDSPYHSLGRENSIDVISYTQSGSTSSTRRSYEPIRIRKTVDRSSPLIAKALGQNESIDATFRFFRPNPSGDGTTEQFYTVRTTNARIASQRTAYSEDGHLVEEVQIAVQNMEWTFTNGGIVFQDDVSGR